MLPNDEAYRYYVSVLEDELRPATGCTEPVAIAYCAATARKLLSRVPEKVFIEVSGNIVKNVKSVIVPGTGGLKGIEAAAAAGIIAGDADKQLEVITGINDIQRQSIAEYLKSADFTVRCVDTGHIFDIAVTLFAAGESAKAQIVDFHTNIVLIEHDGITIKHVEANDEATSGAECDAEPVRAAMCVEEILDFANTVRIDDVKALLDRQISCNTAISKAGLEGSYGAGIGSVLLSDFGNGIKNRARAAAAAASDARMGGCDMPVVIVSGSGNQGITASLPVIEYAQELGVSDEKLYRALVLSVLITVHQKAGIGRLSAYCGAISAGTGAGAGIAYLHGGGYDEIAHTIVNALAILSGVVCDGAKPSCAAKIASAVEAGILGYHMYLHDKQFYDGEGIVKRGVDNTIANVGRMAREGMRETDKTILKIMTGE